MPTLKMLVNFAFFLNFLNHSKCSFFQGQRSQKLCFRGYSSLNGISPQNDRSRDKKFSKMLKLCALIWQTSGLEAHFWKPLALGFQQCNEVGPHCGSIAVVVVYNLYRRCRVKPFSWWGVTLQPGAKGAHCPSEGVR